MASFKPISVVPTKYTLFSGHYLGFEASGTSTTINMATDSTGGTLLARCQVNDDGFFITDASAIFAPHIDQEYKLSLYPSLTDSQNKTNAVWTIDGLSAVGETGITDNIFYAENFATFALAVTGAAGKTLIVSEATATNSITVSGVTINVILGGSIDANSGQTVTLNCVFEAGNYTTFNGAGLIKGDFQGGSLNPFWWGAKGDGTTDDLAAFDKIQVAAGAGPKSIYLPTPPGGFYRLSDVWLLSVGDLEVFGDGPRSMLGSVNTSGKEVMRIIDDHYSLRNFGFTGADGGGHGLVVGDLAGGIDSNGNIFENLLAQWCDLDAIRIEFGQSNSWVGCRVDINNGYDVANFASKGLTRGNPTIGIHITGHVNFRNNDNRFTNCQINGAARPGDDDSWCLKVGDATTRVDSFSWTNGLIQAAGNYQQMFISALDSNIDGVHIEPPNHEVFPTQGSPYTTFLDANSGAANGSTLVDTSAFTSGQFDDNVDSGQAIYVLRMGVWAGGPTGETVDITSNDASTLTLKTNLSAQVVSGDKYQVINKDSLNNFRATFDNCLRLTVNACTIQGDVAVTGTTDIMEMQNVSLAGIDIGRDTRRLELDGFIHSNIIIGPAGGQVIDRSKDSVFKRVSNASNERGAFGTNLNSRSTKYFHSDFSTWLGGSARSGIPGLSTLASTTTTGFFSMRGFNTDASPPDSLTFTDTTQEWVPSTLVGFNVEVLAGTNVGENRIVESNTADTIVTTLAFTADMDLTSEYRISATYVINVATTTSVSVGGGDWITDSLIGRSIRFIDGLAINDEIPITDNTNILLTVGSAFATTPSSGDKFVVSDMDWVKSGSHAFKMKIPTELTSGLTLNLPVLNASNNDGQVHFKIKTAAIGTPGNVIVKAIYNGGDSSFGLSFDQFTDAISVPYFQTLQGSFNIIDGTTGMALTVEGTVGIDIIIDEMEIWIDDYRVSDWLDGEDIAIPEISVTKTVTGPQSKFIVLPGTTLVTDFVGAHPGQQFTVIGTGAKSVQDISVAGNVNTKTGSSTSINGLPMHLVLNPEDGEFYEI